MQMVLFQTTAGHILVVNYGNENMFLSVAKITGNVGSLTVHEISERLSLQDDLVADP